MVLSLNSKFSTTSIVTSSSSSSFITFTYSLSLSLARSLSFTPWEYERVPDQSLFGKRESKWKIVRPTSQILLLQMPTEQEQGYLHIPTRTSLVSLSHFLSLSLFYLGERFRKFFCVTQRERETKTGDSTSYFIIPWNRSC